MNNGQYYFWLSLNICPLIFLLIFKDLYRKAQKARPVRVYPESETKDWVNAKRLRSVCSWKQCGRTPFLPVMSFDAKHNKRQQTMRRHNIIQLRESTSVLLHLAIALCSWLLWQIMKGGGGDKKIRLAHFSPRQGVSKAPAGELFCIEPRQQISRPKMCCRKLIIVCWCECAHTWRKKQTDRDLRQHHDCTSWGALNGSALCAICVSGKVRNGMERGSRRGTEFLCFLSRDSVSGKTINIPFAALSLAQK